MVVVMSASARDQHEYKRPKTDSTSPRLQTKFGQSGRTGEREGSNGRGGIGEELTVTVEEAVGGGSSSSSIAGRRRLLVLVRDAAGIEGVLLLLAHVAVVAARVPEILQAAESTKEGVNESRANSERGAENGLSAADQRLTPG
jgi:hypothetical protein